MSERLSQKRHGFKTLPSSATHPFPIAQFQHRIYAMCKFFHCGRIVAVVLLCSLLGCSDWNQANVLTGHFFMQTRPGTIRLYLRPDNTVEETIIPRRGKAQTIEGIWKFDGFYVAIKPFVDWGSGSSPVMHDSWRALAQYDHKHNLQLLLYENRGAYFEREHPLTLAMIQRPYL